LSGQVLLNNVEVGYQDFFVLFHVLSQKAQKRAFWCISGTGQDFHPHQMKAIFTILYMTLSFLIHSFSE